ncbi:putative F-box/LRR-repeat protein 23 [Vicia villosa]|uniref:putative F-box/LRR-repeat protein 23 n=1 Tax=Vicia villosa TaxID=3911 RepID=UPI00273B9706|nr:putative F-box/LRR-repeat protein 23 [Vicia villosa]
MASSSIQASEVEKKSTTDHPDWLELPRDVTANILKRLDTVEIVTSACLVCPLWWNICNDSEFWGSIRMTKLRYSSYDYEDNLIQICLYAIDLSCGQLEEINIDYFATDDILALISNRYMRLIDCGALSDIAFCESVMRLQHLEELEISFNNGLSKYDSLELVGRGCRLLKSLKYTGVVVDNKGNDVLFSIAKSMPGLHRLKISGDMPTDDGVVSVLDGCTLLESFDLRGCCTIHFSESLEKRCRHQIKDFGPPLQLSCASNWDFGISSYVDSYFNMD